MTYRIRMNDNVMYNMLIAECTYYFNYLFVCFRKKYEEILKAAHCEIIGYTRNNEIDAYVLR